jgi:hypothetical protein
LALHFWNDTRVTNTQLKNPLVARKKYKMMQLKFFSPLVAIASLAGSQALTLLFARAARENENSCPALSGSPAGERKTAREREIQSPPLSQPSCGANKFCA